MCCMLELKLIVKHNWEFIKAIMIILEKKVYSLKIINIEINQNINKLILKYCILQLYNFYKNFKKRIG
jgi:hypothetical protein